MFYPKVTAIEKISTAKVDGLNNTKVSKIGRAELKPFLNNLYIGLLSIVDNVELNKSEYVMKCIMRALCVTNSVHRWSNRWVNFVQLSWADHSIECTGVVAQS